MAQWYRWSNPALAQAALDFINSNQNLPLVGRNAKTGTPQPDKQKTVNWAEDVTACTDGKYGFPRVPAHVLEHIGIAQEQAQQFFDTYHPDIEEFDPAWIPEDEES